MTSTSNPAHTAGTGRRNAWILLGILPALAWSLAQAQETGLQPGQPAPPFTLQTLDGKQQLHSEDWFKTRPLTILILWDSYCPDCLRAVIACGTFATRADSLGADLLSINFDHEFMPGVYAFVKKEALPFPVLWDADQQVARAYRAEKYDFSLFLVDREGVFRQVHYDHPPSVPAYLDSVLSRIIPTLAAPDSG